MIEFFLVFFSLVVARNHETRYYLALGDSLSIGIQPVGANKGEVPTSTGYVDDIARALSKADPHRHLVKLGCSGETVETMINGSCPGPAAINYKFFDHASSQLEAAISFLKTFGDQTDLITIDIGANDVDGCVNASSFEKCASTGTANVLANLPTVLAALRGAAPSALIIGMNYYDPFLVGLLTAPGGNYFQVAVDSLGFAPNFNSALASVFAKYQVHLADVSAAFQSANMTDVTLIGVSVPVPEDVAVVCELTWVCTLGNIHATDNGYALIAQTFLSVIANTKPTLITPLRRSHYDDDDDHHNKHK